MEAAKVGRLKLYWNFDKSDLKYRVFNQVRNIGKDCGEMKNAEMFEVLTYSDHRSVSHHIEKLKDLPQLHEC